MPDRKTDRGHKGHGGEREIQAETVQLGRGLEGGIGEAQRGPVIGSMLPESVCVSVCVCVCCDSECLVCRAPLKLTSQVFLGATKHADLFVQSEEFVNAHLWG